MKNYRFICLIYLIFLSCNSQPKTTDQPLSESEKIDSLKKDELKEPINHQYLVFNQRATIRPTYKETDKNKTAIHDGFVVNLNLKNNAKQTTYSHIELEISYFSKDGKIDASEKILVKSAVKPGKQLVTSRKVKLYKNTGYAVKLIGAKGNQ